METTRKSASGQLAATTMYRRVLDLRRIAAKLKRTRMTALQVCQAIIEGRLVERETRAFFSGLPDDERHYWIASLYTLLMPIARRRKLAAYFTPPHLARYAIDMLLKSGIRLGEHKILDPASGGAAFLVPLAARIAEKSRRKGERISTTLQSITSTLHGIEIDHDLGKLSQALLLDLISEEAEATGADLSALIDCADTLTLNPSKGLYDAVIGNPPYGRIFRPTKKLKQRYKAVISDGYVNLYSLFVEQSLRWVRPGGIVCLIIPISFVGGPYFAALRKRILQRASVLRIDLIDQRSDVFLDVLHDLCVMTLRRHDGMAQIGAPQSALLLVDDSRPLGTIEIPAKPTTAIWALPDGEEKGPLFHKGLSNLADYGYLAKTGYFVWNREQHRYRVGHKPRSTEIPLYWAHNVRANKPCQPLATDAGQRIGFAKIPKNCPGIIHSDAVILQRTSNRRQKRRLIAGTVRADHVVGGGGFITENHTIVITPDPTKKQLLPVSKLCRLLNTAAVDGRFRRMSGSVSISTKALRELPLPNPTKVKKLLNAHKRTDDEAAVAAYEASLASSRGNGRKGASPRTNTRSG